MVGAAWILAGVLSAAVGLYLVTNTACSCPEIPVNATPQQVASTCPCRSNGPLFIAVGSLAGLLGLGILFFKRKLVTYV